MPATVIDGKSAAAALRQGIAGQVAEHMAAGAPRPTLAVILVGDDPASAVYVRNKVKATQEVGMRSIERRLPDDTSQSHLQHVITELNEDDAVDGILLQLPLPGHLNDRAALDCIDPNKDVDGLTITNIGRLVAGEAGLVPCTPAGCMILLEQALPDGMSGRRALVIGRSLLFGKPMAQLLLSANCTVTTAHSRTSDLADECRRADILIAALGKPEFVQGDWIKPGATVIDVGINRVERRGEPGKTDLVGDIAYEAAMKRAAAITPVPGGVGPMTIACLLQNTLTAATIR